MFGDVSLGGRFEVFQTCQPAKQQRCANLKFPRRYFYTLTRLADRRESVICIQTNKMHKILVIRLYFLLDALYVSDYISPSSGAIFISCTSHLVYAFMWL